MTRAELLQDRTKAYALRCAEAAYDAILDRHLPGFLPSERASDDSYLLQQKMRFHKQFSDSYVNYLAGEASGFDFPESLRSLGADGEWSDLVKSLQKVNAQPIPVYDENNHKALSEGRSAFQFRMQDEASRQPVYFSAAKGEVFSFTQEKIEEFIGSGSNAAIDDTGRIRLSGGSFQGYFQPWKRHQAQVYAANAGPLTMNEFLKSAEEHPLSVSECIRMHDDLMAKAPGSDGLSAVSLQDVYDSFISARHYAEGDAPPSFEDFSSYAESHGPVGPDHGSFLSSVPLRSVITWMNDKKQVTMYDLFGKDGNGRENAYSSYAQAFFNSDLDAQAKAAGLVPATAKRSKSGDVLYEDKNGEIISPNMAYTDPLEIKPMCFPVVSCDAKGNMESGPSARIFMADLAKGEVGRNGLQLSASDRIGLSALRPFLRKETYDGFESELEELIESGSLEIPANSSRLNQAVRNGVTVLEELDKRGLRYEIHSDISKGQLSASVEDPMTMQFRIMDLQYPEYIGRAYYSFNNTTTRFSNDGAQKKGPDGRWKSDPIYADEAMTRDLVAYALGEPVKIRSSKNGTLEVNGNKDALTGTQGTLSFVTKSGLRLGGSSYVSDPGKTYHASYVKNNGKGFAAIYSADTKKVGQRGQMTVMSPIRISSDRMGDASKMQTFATGEDAASYLREARAEASHYLHAEVMNALFDAEEGADGSLSVKAKPEEALLTVSLSEDPAIRSLQQQYITYLTTDDAVLRDMDASGGTMSDTLDDIYTLEWMGLTDTLGDKRSKEEHILDSLRHVSDVMIGRDGKNADGMDTLGFNFANVAKYGGFRDTDLLRAIQAVQKVPNLELNLVSEEEAASMNRIKERSLSYDPSTGIDLKARAAGSPFLAHIHDVVRQSLEGHGVNITALEMDDNGIIHYSGMRHYGENVASEEAYGKKREGMEFARDYRAVDGQIGQIFEPDENGVIVTKFGHGDNYSMVPGYTATVHRGEGSVESRTVCRGYQQMLDAKLRAELHQSLCLGTESDPLSATGINRLYRHLYDERYPEDYKAYFERIGMDDSMMHALIDSQKNMVRYDKRYIEESTLNARMNAMKSNLFNDAAYDGYSVTGRDLSVMGWSDPGYFDSCATQSNIGQGISRCLVSGASVDDTGHIVKSDIPYDRSPMLMEDFAKNINYNPFDRRVMVHGNLMHSYGVTGREQTAHMTLEGWTMDDAFVVSSDYAKRHMVPGSDDSLRPLRRGDKISDMNGNKGVISLVVDPDMDPAEAERRKIAGPVKLFRDNPNLNVVGSPFTAPSRMNGGTARDMMDGLAPEGLILKNGREIPGAMGSIHYIITDKTAEEKTHQYGEEEVLAGKGRSVSSQMLWSLQARNANALVSEFFSGNANNLSTIREKMIVLGMDLDEDYTIREGFSPHRMPDGTPEERPIIDLPALPENFKEMTQPQVNAWKAAAVKESFGKVARNGGFLRLPYPITTAYGSEIPQAPDGNGYLLPLMPPHFRSEQSYDDNTSIYHDYTQYYGQIAEKALTYISEEARPVKDKVTHENKMEAVKTGSQLAYDRMAEEIKSLSFDNKQNDWKKRAMSHKVPHSFTAVGVPDPRLDLNEVSMSSDMAKDMGLEEGGRMLLWRDPLLRPEGICYMKVHIDDELEGIALNPVMDKRFDGDFDGDTWGGVKVETPEAQAEAMRLFSPEMTLIDLGTTPDEYAKEDISFALNMGLDIASAKGVRKGDPADIAVEEVLDRAKEKIADGWYEEGFDLVNQYVHERLSQAHGSTVIRYDSMESHMESVCEMVNIGAKGKPKGIMEYAHWLGVDLKANITEDGKIYPLEVTDLKTPGLTDVADAVRRAMLHNMDTQVSMATAIKSFGTGRAGSVSQKNVGFSRKDCPDSPNGDAYLRYALEVTYGATQGILQAKHDAKEALQKYRILTDVLPALYAGKAICEDANGNWGPKEVDGKPVWNSKQDFIDQYDALCKSKTGLNFDLCRDNLEKLADCLYDGNEDVYGRERIRTAKDKAQTDVATIDHLAYAGGGFDTLKSCVGRQLFNTPMSQVFAPKDPKDPSRFASLAAGRRVFESVKSGKRAKDLAAVQNIDRNRVNSYQVSRGAVTLEKGSNLAACFAASEELTGGGEDLEQAMGE